MIPATALDMIETALTPVFKPGELAMLVRVPEGLIILVRNGGHVLIRADNAELVVKS